MTEAEMYEKIKVAQAAAVEQVRIKHGKTHADVAAVLNAPPKPAPMSLAAENEDRARRQRAEYDFKSMGISQVTTEEAAAILIAQERHMQEKDNHRARAAADALASFRREVQAGRVTPGSRFYVDPLNQYETVMDARTGKPTSWDRNAKVQEMIDAAETALIYATLQAGEPAPVKTPAQRAQERYNAEQNG